MKYEDLDYDSLNLSGNLTVEDIHKIRRYEYEATKDMSSEEFLEFYHKKLQKEREQWHKLFGNKEKVKCSE